MMQPVPSAREIQIIENKQGAGALGWLKQELRLDFHPIAAMAAIVQMEQPESRTTL